MRSFIPKISYLMYEKQPAGRLAVAGLILGLMIGAGALVYMTGGTKLSYLQLFYVPILIAGFWFGPLTGSLLGLAAGLIVGPLMPESVQDNICQAPQTWVFRLGFFIVMGALAGFGSRLTQAYFKVIEQRFLTDSVTQLPNYAGLQKIYNSTESLHNLSGIILVKLKQFQDVELGFGPATTDKVALACKERLLSILGARHTVGRLSPDCFVLCLEKKADPVKLAQYLVEGLDNTYQFNDIPFLIESYFGVVTVPLSDEQPAFDAGLKNALVAANEGIKHNKVISVFNNVQQDLTKRNLFIVHELNQAILQEELLLHYQPLIALADGRVKGVEALARWQHPTLGMVSPAEFIAIAEKTLLINPLIKCLLKQALRQLSQWRMQGYNLLLSVNFSVRNLEDPSVIKALFDYLKHYDIPFDAVQIELTESTLAPNMMHVADVLQSLREKRLKIAIDDFGTGHSSLEYLFDLPIDAIKIDRTFTDALLHNSAAEAIVRSAITMAHELNLEIIAEGIEQEAQLKHLQRLGCDGGQGYYIAKPMPAETFIAWLDARHKG
jgi:EAL domain-containing protein (putative c-di-GMP-specific phosphodiesterase class I)/GGDEF domain-containing protein